MKFDCPYCQQSLTKAAEEWAKWQWVGPGDRPKPRCPSCGGAIAQRVYLEEVASLAVMAAAILFAFWWLDGKPAFSIVWAALGLVLVAVPLAKWADGRLRDAQRYKRGDAI